MKLHSVLQESGISKPQHAMRAGITPGDQYIVISTQQARDFAYSIVADISGYLTAHQEEYQEFLRQYVKKVGDVI